MKKLLLILLLINSYLFFSQSLSPVFSSENQMVDNLTAQAKEQMIKNPDNLNALKTAEKAKQIAIKSGDDLTIAKANATLGWIFLDSDNLDAAQNFVEKAFKNIENKKYPEAEAMLHHQIAIILDKKAQPKEALKHYLKSADYYKNSKNFVKLEQVYLEISRLYLTTGNKDSFQKYFKQSEDLLKKYPETQLQLTYNNQKNYILMDEGKFEEAYNLNMQSAKLAEKNNKKKFVSTALFNAAGALFEQGKTDEAEKLVDKGLDYAKKNNLDFGDFLVGKAQLFASKGKIQEAEQMYTDALNQLVKSKNKLLEMQVRKLFSDFYRSQNKNEESANQFLAYKKIEDSIASAKQAIALKEVEYKYRDQEKEELLKSYKTSSILKNWLAGVSSVLALGALFLFFNLRKNSRLTRTLFEKKEKLLESEKLNALREKELAKKEEEKALLNEKLLMEEQKSLKLEKENTDRELASITLYVQEKNKMLEDLQAKMDGLLNNSSQENREKLLDISRNLKQSISFEKDWDKIKLHFEKVHPEFFTKLSEKYPNLTPNELKQCAYIKMNMSNKETGNLLGIDHNSVKMSRYRIKKKMDLPQEDDLSVHIQNL